MSVEEVERALIGACRRTEAEVVEFTVAPRTPSLEYSGGGHEWPVEFRVPPTEPDTFLRIVDETLAVLNVDYRSGRAASGGLLPPRLTALPGGTFHTWMRRRHQLGAQHKVPRVSNDRTLAEALLGASGTRATTCGVPTQV